MNAFREAVKLIGGQEAVIQELSKHGIMVTQSCISKWLNTGVARPDWAVILEAKTNISKKKLCPQFAFDKSDLKKISLAESSLSPKFRLGGFQKPQES
ncbi:hypothetical protein [Wohlfahrtiimonas populi]|uniref:hypothetical protein n=1 Tax=Wohlfahrtiimonas populi TaxID=1940240 RepID=UPI00098D3EFB|nr:hypothetical protein [Wohlfahrtiimonas populi]